MSGDQGRRPSGAKTVSSADELRVVRDDVSVEHRASGAGTPVEEAVDVRDQPSNPVTSRQRRTHQSPDDRRGSARGAGQRTERSDRGPRDRVGTARQIAFTVIDRALYGDAYANLLLPALLHEHNLDPREAALATELAYGTLRNVTLYESVIQACSRRSVDTLDRSVRVVLLLGVHQLIATRIPPHAAVDQTVHLARSQANHGASMFVNAVMRAVSERDRAAWIADVVPPSHESLVEHLAVRYSHPEWVVRALRESLVGANRPADEIASLLATNNEPGPVHLVVLPGFDSDTGDLPAGRWSPLARRLAGSDPARNALVSKGLARVQDEGSQLAALLLAHAPLAGPDRQWADLCAGPGGKTAVLAATAAGRGARVLATELQSHRAGLVEQAVHALSGVVDVRTEDGRTVGQDFPERFDRVLVDVPCTGLGALRRRPEARWRRRPADLATLAPLQRELLASAVEATRPGGLIAYVTCSPHPVETRLVVADSLKRYPDLKPMDAVDVLAELTGQPMDDATGPLIGTGSKKVRTVQLWPHLHDTDAMFVALLQRRG